MHRSLLLYIPAAALLVVSQGEWIIPLAAWLAPVFLLRFLRTQPARRGLLLGLVAFEAAFKVVLAVFVASLGAVAYLPFVADRLLAPHLPGWAGALVLPVAEVALEFLNARLDPMGSWGAWAYTQVGNLPLLQVAAFTGMWGITFMIAWTAGVANWAWEQDWRLTSGGVKV